MGLCVAQPPLGSWLPPNQMNWLRGHAAVGGFHVPVAHGLAHADAELVGIGQLEVIADQPDLTAALLVLCSSSSAWLAMVRS